MSYFYTKGNVSSAEITRQILINYTIIVDSEPERRREVIVGTRAQVEVRKNFFTVRVEKAWNELPESVKAQRTINGFKNHYDRWREQSLLQEKR